MGRSARGFPASASMCSITSPASGGANLWPPVPGVKTIDVVLDGAVEIGFPNNEDMDRFVTASPILFGDEINCFVGDAAFFLPDGSRTFVDRQADGIPNGPDHLHRLHVYMNGSLDAEFNAWATGLAASYAGVPAVQKLRLHLPQPFDNANPQPPSPVDHRVPDDMLKLAVMEIGFATALSARQFFESDHFKATVAGMSRHVHAMNAFLVTGVYTYVRDSVPTMAGLRGSRAAEIIERIGATNHWDGAVHPAIHARLTGRLRPPVH